MKNTDTETGWRGYDYNQLVYRRMINSARIEAQKHRLIDTAQTLKKKNPLISMRNARALFSAISYIDYAVLAVRLYRRIKPLFSNK